MKRSKPSNLFTASYSALGSYLARETGKPLKLAHRLRTSSFGVIYITHHAGLT